MDEIENIIIMGFSGTLEEFYQDKLSLHRSGEIYYRGIHGNKKSHWMSSSDSDGYALLFSTLVIEFMQAEKNKVITDEKRSGYVIEVIYKDQDKASFTFYGLMEENNQEYLRDALVDFFPAYEEFPEYMMVKKSDDLSEENMDFIEESVS